MKLTFETILNEYLNRKNFANKKISEEYKKGFKASNLIWFSEMKDFCDDFNPKMRTPTESEQKEFFNGEEDFPLVAIIDYRGTKIPVYDDDYGQCYFCILPSGKTISGGTYNMCPEKDFCEAYDIDLESEEEKYD